MAYVREGLDAHVNEFIDKRITNSFVQFNPLLYFLALLDQNTAQTVGATARHKLDQHSPDANTVFGTGRMEQAQMEEVLGSKNHHFRFVKAEPDDGEYMSYGGATPEAAAYAEDNFGTAETRWTHIMEPVKVRKHSLEQAQGEHAVNAIVDDSMVPIWERFIKRINQGLWSGTRTQSQQNDQVWGAFLGLTHTLTAGNYYGRVDRSTETELNPVVIVASSDLTTTIVDLDLMREINTGAITAAGDGLASKDPNGVGATCQITTSKLWNELATQSEARGYNIRNHGVENHYASGFKFPVIEHENGYITWDPNCPEGESYFLNLETWLMEVMRGHNFAWLGFFDQSQLAGGNYEEQGKFSFQGRLTCRAPHLNAIVTNLTVS